MKGKTGVKKMQIGGGTAAYTPKPGSRVSAGFVDNMSRIKQQQATARAANQARRDDRMQAKASRAAASMPRELSRMPGMKTGGKTYRKGGKF